ncbi:MAG TPA: hypothetical protein VLL72_11620, partial [Kiloniellales bacterium]|nr:hypothetical protein [Kiloniellales bacterium]
MAARKRETVVRSFGAARKQRARETEPEPSRSGAADAGSSAGTTAAGLIESATRALFEQGPPACVTDADGRLVLANAGFQRIATALAAAGLAPGGLAATQRYLNAQALQALREIESLESPEGAIHAITVDGRTERVRIAEQPVTDADGTRKGT